VKEEEMGKGEGAEYSKGEEEREEGCGRIKKGWA
jgi:hypothetical protein